jgi:hypothetical protein
MRNPPGNVHSVSTENPHYTRHSRNGIVAISYHHGLNPNIGCGCATRRISNLTPCSCEAGRRIEAPIATWPPSSGLSLQYGHRPSPSPAPSEQAGLHSNLCNVLSLDAPLAGCPRSTSPTRAYSDLNFDRNSELEVERALLTAAPTRSSRWTCCAYWALARYVSRR